MDTTPVSLLYRLRHQPTAQEWERFVTNFAPILFRWARQLGAQTADAEDLIQDVLLKVIKKMRSFEYDPGKSFRGLLRIVLRNAWLDRCRQRDREVVLSDEQNSLPDGNEDDGNLDDYRLEVVGRAVELIRGDFEPKTWQAVWESVTGDEPISAVAQRHGMSRNALYLARCRVLRRLRVELEGLIT